MTIVLTLLCIGFVILTIFWIVFDCKLNRLQKDLDDYKNAVFKNINGISLDQASCNANMDDLNRKLNHINEYITEPQMQIYANTAVSDALDGVDFDLEKYDNAIKAMWQAIGTQKKRLDKIDPVKREPIDPAENLKHQSELMDKMLKQSTDIYAEKLSKSNLINNAISTGDLLTPEMKHPKQTPIIGIDSTEKVDFYKDQDGVHKATIITPARGSGKDLYSKYMEKLNDVKDNFPASKESDTVAFPSDPEIDQYATTQIPTFANNSVEDLDETMDISEFFTRVKNN